MASSYAAKLIDLLGAMSREGRTGRLHLDAGRGEAGGSMAFASGALILFRPADDATAPASGEIQALRQAIGLAAGSAGSCGASPGFHPEPVEPALEAGGPADLTAADLAIDLSRQIQDASWLKARLRIAPAERVCRPASPPRTQPRAALGPGEGFLLSRADGTLTLQQILDTTPLGEIETLRVLYVLTEVGMLVAGRSSQASQAAGAGSESPLSDLDRFLKRTAPRTPAPGPPRRAGTSQPPQPAPAEPSREIAQGSVPLRKYTPEQQKERDQLLERCRSISGLDHYTILGVERTAGESTIRHAYYGLARLYHPDRLLKPHLEDIHRDLEGMFAAITEAYNTLSDPTARAEYGRELLENKTGRRKDQGLDKHAVARDLYLRGRKEMEAKNLFEAIRMFETAVENDPSRAEYFHFLGVCQAQNPRWRKKAEENLLKAIQLKPGGVQSHLELARVYKKGGLERRALEIYEEVLRWAPDNEEALTMLGRHKDAGSSARILRTLFKKD